MKGKSKKILIASIITSIVIVLVSLSTILLTKVDKSSSQIDSEILRSMNYTQITDADSKIDGSDYVQFSSFFTRDLDGDGNAEKLLGTCRNVNSTDTLYMDINVLTNGYLKDGRITINSTNFNYSMNMVKDSVLKNNYISDNVKEIELNRVNAGTQKLIIGDVIANIGNDTNNYSKVSSVTLTGTHVSDEGVETPISKTINVTVDWHGTTRAYIYAGNHYYNYDQLDTETISFNFTLDELQRELILKENVATLIIPELNGYAPTEVKCTNDNVESEYNEETKTLTIKRSSKINENGVVTSTLSRSNTYTVNVTYPKEAYDQISSYTTLRIPVTGYYTGYNNANEEFENPHKSNIVNGNITLIFRETPKGEIYNFYVDFVDKKYVSTPNYRYVISKQDILNLYDNYDEESTEAIKNKEYVVKWLAVRGSEGIVPSMIMSETKEEETATETGSTYGDKWNSTIMEQYVTNTGIYFANADQFLEENGTISVYNNNTNELIKTFTKEEWSRYSRENPYKYETPVKHIRVETSKTNLNCSLSVYNVKELEIAKVLEDFTKEQVKDIELVYTYLTGICNIEGQASGTRKDIDYAYYVSEKSNSKITVENEKLSTQETLNNQKIYIDAIYNQEGDAKWQNGEFLVEVPEEIINMEINNVTINNEKVKIVAYDLFEKDGKYFIKVITENEEPVAFKITIDCNITPDPRIATTNKEFKLYSYNKYCNDYYYQAKDIYDVDNDNNVEEQVGTSATSIQLLSPTSLITLETISNYNQENEITIAPNVAGVERDTRQATVNIDLTNNYTNIVTGVQILGKIPFEGNTYILNGRDLKSKFSTTMTNDGITVPEELQEKTIVYYSEKENPSKDLLDSENGWTLKENVQDFSKIKSYLIDLKEYTIEVGKGYTFNYVVNLPENINYNLASFSDHAVYYELDTEGGKLTLSTEPNKVGVRIVKKFDLEITKYKINSNVVIPGVTYTLKYEEENVDGELEEKTRILTTNNEGKINLKNLYAEKTYKLQELRVPNTCEIDTEEKIITINADGTVNIEGAVKNQNFEDGEIFKIELEDEVKYDLEINKSKIGGNIAIDAVRFRLEDEQGNRENVRTQNGKAILEGLRLNKVYTLTETATPTNCEINNGEFKFKIVRTEGNLNIETITNTLLAEAPVVQNEPDVLKPVLKVNVQNEIKYELNLLKQDKEGNKLPGVQFTIKGEGFGNEGTKYSTNKEGKLSIYGLSLGKTYTLEEVKAEGYYLDSTKNNKITFVVERTANGLQVTTWEKGETIIEVGTASVTESGLTASLDVVLENEKIPTYNLKLVKVNKDGEKLQGAEFKLTSLDTNKEQIETVDENGELTFEGLYEYIDGKCITGEYTLEETFAPEGYVLDNTKLKFKATRDEQGKIQVQILEGDTLLKDKVVENAEEGVTEKDITSDENTLTLNILNKPIFKLVKQGDNNTLLPNAKFTITDLDGNYVTGTDGKIVGKDEVINGRTYKVISTNDKGELSANLPEGLYKAVEIQAPDGYVLPEKEKDRTYYFGIGRSQLGVNGGPADSVKWAKSIKSDLISELKQVVPLDDDGVIAVGRTYTNTDINGDGTVDNHGKGNYDGIIIKYDKDGNIEWSKTLGGKNNEAIFSISKDPNGGFVVAGYTDSPEVYLDNTLLDTNYFGNEDGIVVKLDSSGNYVWSQSIGGTGVDRINSVTVSESGDVAVVGSYTSTELNTNKEETDSLENQGAASKNKNAFIVVFSGAGVYKWSQNIGGTEDTTGASVIATDSGFAVAVNFIGTAYLNTSKTSSVVSTGKADGVVILYTGNGSISWYKQIGSSNNDNLTQITKDKDGNIIVAGSYAGSVTIGTSSVATKGKYDGVVVKYSETGDYITHKTIGGTDDDTISSVYVTEDGGLLLGGWYYSTAVDLNGYGTNEITSNSGVCDGLVMKLDSDYNLEWYDSIKGTDYDEVTSVVETKERDCIAVGDYESTSITIFNEQNKLTNSKYTDGLIVRYGTEDKAPEVPQMQEITVTNELRKYNITTEIGINSENARTGGKITGEYNEDYPESNNIKFVESVKHGYDSSKSIEIKPDTGYVIKEITSDGESIDFVTNENGSYIIPEGYFKEVKENHHIVVIFAKVSDTLIINKVDSDNNTKVLPGAKFKIEQIEDRPQVTNEVGSLTGNGATYTVQNLVTGVLGSLTNNGTYYFTTSNGTYIPNNQGKDNTNASSYIPIDLTGKSGSYTVTVNAQVSSESNWDWGYARITQNTTAPTFDKNTNPAEQFMKISGTVSSQNYSYTIQGGSKYYLHLGYYKDSSNSSNNDRVTINSVNVYQSVTETYNFTQSNGKYISSNQGKHNTVSNSYIPIDLTNTKGKYTLTVNAEVSSESGCDIGYATVTKNTSRPEYSSTTGRFIYIHGTQSAKDYKTVLDGGYKYYLHLGYRKDGSVNTGTDTFTVNSVTLSLNTDDFYKGEFTTNSNGQIIETVPLGKYIITELEAPDGYALDSKPREVTLSAGNCNITIENKKSIPFEIIKKDKETNEPIQGAKFAIYSITEGYEIIDFIKYNSGNYIGEKNEDGIYLISTDENGKIELSLAPGLYKVVEVVAPDGYVLEENESERTTFFEIEDSTGNSNTYESNTQTNDTNVNGEANIEDLVKLPNGENPETAYQITITNVKEKDNLIISKIDKDTGKKLAGAKFRLENSTSKTNLIGDIKSNSQYKFSKYGVSGYQSDNYNVSDSVANAYFPIDLREYEGTFKLTVNYTISSQSNNDYGYATITTSTNVPTYDQNDLNNNIKRFIYTSGSYDNQTSSISLTGGQKYYLHIGYRKDDSINTENDRFYINSMNLTYSSEVETNGDGIASVKVPTGIYTVTETQAPLGYELNSVAQTVEILDSTQTKELVFENTKQEGDIHNQNFILTKKDKITDEIMPGVKFMVLDEQGNYAKDYTGTIVGEKEEIDGQEKYVVTTDINGQVKLKLNIGKYKVVEVKTLEGYVLEDEKEFEITSENESTPLELTVTNQKAGRVIVHHYLEGTGSEFGNEPVVLAEDELLEGKIPEEYITSPNMKIEGYSLIKDEKGEYVIPANASGTYTEEEQNVYYYYNRKPLELIVHHYLEGTENKVPLGKDEQGNDKFAEDEHYYYQEGDHYKTNASEEVLKSYEFVEVVGDEEKDITQDEVVTYYYRIKKHEITTRVEIPEGRTEDEKGGQISGEGEKPYETVDHGKTSTKDIKITPDEGYRIKQIRLVSTNEEGVRKESIIYGENRTENVEITYNQNVDNSVTLTKFENMTEDKEVIVVFEPNEGRLIVHHYIENTQEKIYEDQVTVGIVGQKVETNPVKVENYVVVKEPADRNATITEETQEKTYYYQRQYKITTDVIEHNETYKNGEVKENVKGGSITSEDEVAHEYVLKGRASQKEIKIVPTIVRDENGETIEEYEIVKVVIKDGKANNAGKIYDFKDKLEPDGSLILRAGEDGIFPDMQSDKHVEVEFRKKTRVIVKHLEVGTEKVLYTTEDGKDYEEILGYEGKEFETYRRVIANYKASDLGITDENKVAIEPDGTMFADEITIIYWYEKVPSGVLVKHVEKVTNKTINEETGEEEITVTGVVLDEEVIPGYAGNTETTNRKNFENYIPAENKDATEGINVGKDENSKTVTMKQDEVVEVVYWYEKEFKITTDVKEYTEKVINSETGEEETITVRGGTISGEDETPYEKVIRSNDSTKEIKIVPDDGYQIKKVWVNGKEIYVEDKIAKDGSLVLDKFTNMQEDKHVEVEFEKIPAKVIVKYVDKYTKESLAEDKIIDGYVNDQYDEKRIEVDGYIPTNPEPENSKGSMTKDVITVVYYYTKEFKITTDVKEHLEDKEKNVVEVFAEKILEIIQGAGTSGDSTGTEANSAGNNSNTTGNTTEGSEDNANGKPNIGNTGTENTAHDILTPLNPDEIPEGKIAIKGGTITGEDETPYESVLRGENNKKQIKIVPDEGYRIKYLAIKDGKIEYTLDIASLLTKENTIILPEEYFKNMQADKHIVVEFEPIPAKVVVNYLDIETKDNEEPKEVAKQEIGEGFVNYEYKTHEKEVPYYELVKEELPENAEGKLIKEDTIVNYWYRKLLFNMKITKEFSSIKVNGNEILGDDKKFVKVDIANTDVANTNISVKYKITVTNTEEIEGNATIVEHIPAGFKLATNDTWQEKDGEITLTTRKLKPGETAEYEVTLEWDKNLNCIGSLVNIATITQTQNIPEFTETKLEDNTDSCTLLLAIRTRENRDVKTIISISCFVLAGLCTIAYVISEVKLRTNSEK